MAICWERLSHQLFTVLILNAVLVVLVSIGVWGGMWNSIVSAPDHCLFVYFSHSIQAQGRRRLLKSGPSAEGTGRGEHERGVPPLIRGVRSILSAISVYECYFQSLL